MSCSRAKSLELYLRVYTCACELPTCLCLSAGVDGGVTKPSSRAMSLFSAQSMHMGDSDNESIDSSTGVYSPHSMSMGLRPSNYCHNYHINLCFLFGWVDRISAFSAPGMQFLPILYTRHDCFGLHSGLFDFLKLFSRVHDV